MQGLEGLSEDVAFTLSTMAAMERLGAEKGQDSTQVFTGSLWPLGREQKE